MLILRHAIPEVHHGVWYIGIIAENDPRFYKCPSQFLWLGEEVNLISEPELK